MARQLALFYIIIIAIPQLLVAQDYGITHADSSYSSVAQDSHIAGTPPPIAPLLNITDSLSDSEAGAMAIHQVGFELPQYECDPRGWLRGRQVVMTFPPEFDIRTITSVTYRDTDLEEKDPEIAWIYIYSQSIVVRFSDKLPGPKQSEFAYITLRSVKNSTVPGDYRIVVKIDNANRQTVAGPNFSEPFTINSPGPFAFDIEFPDTVRAGAPFPISISGAEDSLGNPFTGIFTVTGGLMSPDGSLPFLNPVTVINGTGTAQQVLVGTVTNALTIKSGNSVRTVDIVVLPGAIYSLALEIDETQFVANTLRGAASIGAYDRYRNLKTDMVSGGPDVWLHSDSGLFNPSLIHASRFANGFADLSDVIYTGAPGRVTVIAEIVGQSQPIEVMANVYFNGLTVIFDERRYPPEQVPFSWEFSVAGTIRNPGNIAPIDVASLADIVSQDKEAMEPLADRCLPAPFNGTSCKFLVNDTADLTPGAYIFEAISKSLYVIGQDTFTVTQALRFPLEILQFNHFTITGAKLPSIAIQADYQLPLPIVIDNSNQYDLSGFLYSDVYISNENFTTFLGSERTTYSWPSRAEISISGRFSQEMPLGVYNYLAVLRFVSTSNDGMTSEIRKSFPLTNTVEIIPRAILTVDNTSLRPKSVPANTSVSFSLDVHLTGLQTVLVLGSISSLTFTDSDGNVTSSALLKKGEYALGAGITTIETQPLFIPASWIGQIIVGKLRLIGWEDGAIRIDTIFEFASGLTVMPEPALEIISLTSTAPNAPFVNTRQTFELIGRIANNSDQPVTTPVRVILSSDGQSILPPPVVIDQIEAFDTVEVALTVTADSLPRQAEMFALGFDNGQSEIHSDMPPDDREIVTIQIPAFLELSGEIVSPLGPGPLIGYGETFSVRARYANLGQAQISGGKIALDYGRPTDFGVAFPIEAALDTAVSWELTAPDYDINSIFAVKWIEIPLDRNTGLSADTSGSGITVPFTVQRSQTKLVMQADQFTTHPLQRGRDSKLFRLTLENVSNDTRATLLLSTIAIELYDRDGKRISAGSLTSADLTNFYDGDQPLADVRLQDGTVLYLFPNFLISPGQIVSLDLHLTPLPATDLEYFNIRLTGDHVIAWIAQGAPIPVPVTGLLDRPFEISIPKGIIAEDLEKSFRNYPNPFNPNVEKTELRYFLPEAADVDIYIYTATGEAVKEMHYSAGSQGGQSGPNVDIFWDGSNDHGEMVLNGVYLALIKTSSGHSATLKLAVVK